MISLTRARERGAREEEVPRNMGLIVPCGCGGITNVKWGITPAIGCCG
jgi:hypothetical protein